MTRPEAPLVLPPQGGAASGLAKPVPQPLLGQTLQGLGVLDGAPGQDGTALLPASLAQGPGSAPLSEREASRLRWRTRRGLLENDLFIERFFSRHSQHLTVSHARGLYALMDLADNELLDVLLERKHLSEVRADLASDDVTNILKLLTTREKP